MHFYTKSNEIILCDLIVSYVFFRCRKDKNNRFCALAGVARRWGSHSLRIGGLVLAVGVDGREASVGACCGCRVACGDGDALRGRRRPTFICQ